MIKIRLTGTREELTRALSVMRQSYNVLSRSKAHKQKSDSAHWSIKIHAEIKPVDNEVQPSALNTGLTRQDKPTEV